MVLPGPVHDPASRLEVSIHGQSPRKLTAEWGNDPDWPVRAIEKHRDWGADGSVLSDWRLYDASAVYFLRKADNGYEVRGMTYPNTLYLDKRLLASKG